MPLFKTSGPITGAHTWRAKSHEEQMLEKQKKILEEEERRKRKDIKRKMETLEAVRKLEMRSKELNIAAAATERASRHASMIDRENAALMERRRELERLNDVQRSTELERRRREAEELRLRRVRDEERRRAAMRESQLRIESLVMMERNRALTAAENAELARHRAALRELEMVTRQNAVLGGATLGSSLGLPGVRPRANSIGHVGAITAGGIGRVSPRISALPPPGAGGILRPTTPSRLIGPAPGAGNLLNPGLGARPRARSFGAAVPRPIGLAPSPRMVPISHSPRLSTVNVHPVHPSPGLRPVRSNTNIRTVGVPVAVPVRTPRMSTNGGNVAEVAALRGELERMRLTTNMNEREREMLAVKERELARKTAELDRRKEMDLQSRERRVEQRLSELERKEREQDRLIRTPATNVIHTVEHVPVPLTPRTPRGSVHLIDTANLQRPRTPAARTPGGTLLHDFVADPVLETQPGLFPSRNTGLGASPRLGHSPRVTGLGHSPRNVSVDLGSLARNQMPGSYGGGMGMGMPEPMRVSAAHNPHFGDMDAFSDEHSPPFDLQSGRLFPGSGGAPQVGRSISRPGSRAGGAPQVGRSISRPGSRAGGAAWHGESPYDQPVDDFEYYDDEGGDFAFYEGREPDDGRIIIQTIAKVEGSSAMVQPQDLMLGDVMDGDLEMQQAMQDLMYNARNLGANAVTNFQSVPDPHGGYKLMATAVVVQ